MLTLILIDIILYIYNYINFSEREFGQISDYTRSQQKRGFAELITIYNRDYEENRKIIETGSVLSVAS